jgi:hypothetical protein
VDATICVPHINEGHDAPGGSCREDDKSHLRWVQTAGPPAVTSQTIGQRCGGQRHLVSAEGSCGCEGSTIAVYHVHPAFLCLVALDWMLSEFRTVHRDKYWGEGGLSYSVTLSGLPPKSTQDRNFESGNSRLQKRKVNTLDTIVSQFHPTPILTACFPKIHLTN